MILDFHTHVFPEKIAEKAMQFLTEKSGNMNPYTNGTTKSLLEALDSYHTTKAVALNIATNVKQMKNVNDFAASINSDRLISFGSVHPDAPDAIDELYRIKELGLKGIKLHPDYQHFFADEKRMYRIYETAAELGFVTVFHAGVDIGYPTPVHCTPEALSNALPAFSGAPVVAAHFGGYMLWNDVEEYLVGKNIYFDTSYSYSGISVEQAKYITEVHGADKILFGSDMPWSATGREVEFIKSLTLSSEDEEKVLSGNAKRLLNID